MQITVKVRQILTYFRREELRSVVFVGTYVSWLFGSFVRPTGQRLHSLHSVHWLASGRRAGDQHRTRVAGSWRRLAPCEHFF